MTMDQTAHAQGERLIRAVKDQTKVLVAMADLLRKIEARTPDPFDGIELDDIEPEDDNALGRQGGCSDL